MAGGGRATFRIEGDDATARAFNSVVSRAQAARDKIEGFTRSAFVVTGISAFVAKVTEAAKAAIELGDSLNNARIKAGLSGKDMSELAYAAKLADVELSSLSTSLKKMQVLLSNASAGQKDAKKTLHDLGLEYSDLANLKPDEQFELIAEKISQLADEADRARLLTEIFGRSGSDLAVLFEQGAFGIDKARRAAQELGYSFDNEHLQKFADADDAIKKMSASFEVYASNITVKAVPAITRFLDNVTELQKKGFLEVGADFAKSPIGFLSDAFFGNGAPQGPQSGSIIRDVGKNPEIVKLGDLIAENERKFQEAEKKRLDAAQKTADARRAIERELFADVEREANEAAQKDLDRIGKAMDARREENEQRRKDEEDLAVWREERAQQTADFIKGNLMTAYDNFVRNGKARWDELLKYMVAQLARAQFSKFLSGIFNSDSADTWYSKLFGSLFSGGESIDGMASGGYVSAGSTHIVGERGAELFRSPSSGTIIPNHKLGGGNITVAPSYVFNNPTREAIPAMMEMMKRNNEQLKADIADGLRRGRYQIT